MPNPELIQSITLVGIDDHTSDEEIKEISSALPLVELGLVYAPNKEGVGRHASVDRIHDLLDSEDDAIKPLNFSIHIRDLGVRDLSAGEAVVSVIVDIAAEQGCRIFLDGDLASNSKNHSLIRGAIKQFPDAQFVVPAPTADDPIVTAVAGLSNVSHTLERIDVAAGAQWPAPLFGARCGYSGNFPLSRLGVDLAAIQEATKGKPTWITLEEDLRSVSDRFQMSAALDYLNGVGDYLASQKDQAGAPHVTVLNERRKIAS